MESQHSFCAKCGNLLTEGQRFCANCGTERMGTMTSSNMGTDVSIGGVARKSRKKLWVVLGSAALVLALILAVTAVLAGFSNKDRTIMVYMIGSDLESEAAAASLDINEMKGASFDPEHTKVVLYTGGTKKWALDEISADENAIYELVNGKISKVQTYEKSAMTNPEPLVTFVNYAYHNYPAGSYDLILWDHGGGPIVGYGHDENYTFSDPMKVPELAEALVGTDLVKSGGRFDMIGFDACLMGSMEVAKAFSGFSDYLVASEEVEPGRGWNYDFLSDLGNGRVNNTEELGRSIIDHYVNFYVNNDYDVDLTLSLVDLRKVNRVIDAVDGLFAVVKDDITRESFSQYSRLMTRDKVYGYAGRDDKSYDLVDLMDLCGSLRDYFGDEVARVEEGLKDFVIYSKSNLENANGSSVYFLNYNRTGAEEMLAMYRDVAFSNGYYDFLTKYKDFVTGSRMVSKVVYKDLNEEKTEGGIELELTDELKDNYQSGEIIIYRKLDENKYMPVYRSSEVKLEGNKLKATTYDLQFVIEVVEPDGGVEYGWSSMMEKERNESYADYVTSGVLWYEDGSEYGIAPKNYEMYIRVPKGSTEAQIRDIRVSSDDGLSSKMSFDQKKIDIVEFTIGAYKLYNEAGELDYNMESHGSLYGTSVNLGDGDKYRIRLVGLDFDFGDMYDGEFSNLADYYAEFIVHDTQGDAHRLNLVHI